MPKFIESKESQEYKARLREFMQQINPKPTLEQIEKLRQEYLARRVQKDELEPGN